MTQTKEAPKKRGRPKKVKEEPSLDEQIEVLSAPKAVDRVLVKPDGEEVTFTQHEMGFMTKLRFFRLVSGTLRLASIGEDGGVAGFIGEAMEALEGDFSNENAAEFIEIILRLVELSPNFIEEAYTLILKVPQEDEPWVIKALDDLSDEEGLNILEVFVQQNGAALRDFFSKHLSRVGKTISASMGTNEDTEQESETTQ